MDITTILLTLIIAVAVIIAWLTYYITKPKRFKRELKRVFDLNTASPGYYIGYDGFMNGPKHDGFEIKRDSYFRFISNPRNECLSVMNADHGNYETWVFTRSKYNGSFNDWVLQHHSVSTVKPFELDELNVPTSESVGEPVQFIYDGSGHIVGQTYKPDDGRKFFRLKKPEVNGWTQWVQIS